MDGNIVENITHILQAAQQRAQDLGLPYQGALTPPEAYALLNSAPGAKLVDVRTHAEAVWVGRIPDAVNIEWMSFPSMKPNVHFIAQLEQEVSKEVLVLFICRSGQRSNQAAIAANSAGYVSCLNVLEGFEGDLNNHRHRNVLNGWRAHGLPWEQT